MSDLLHQIQIEDRLYYQVCLPVDPRVRAYITTRVGGESVDTYLANNLGTHVGEASHITTANRLLLHDDLNLPNNPLWLDQTHSAVVTPYETNHLKPIGADGSFSTKSGWPCQILTADCIPILLASKSGDFVCAIHAGWRGLLDGIISNAIACYSGDVQTLVAFIGPCIRQTYYQVDTVFKDRFCMGKPNHEKHFLPDGPSNYLCDLPGIAKGIMIESNIPVILDSELDTFASPNEFYSYRRQSPCPTGRQSTLIWID